ncbi:MAG: hypothetical protein J0L97_04145 [Alphaproteobacteria bacterium]|nr:hypothetical protein [Alphaproteobacteria bacterium]
MDNGQKNDAIAAAVQVLKNLKKGFSLKEIWQELLNLRSEDNAAFSDDGDADAAALEEELALRLYGKTLMEIEEEEREKIRQVAREYQALRQVMATLPPGMLTTEQIGQLEALCRDFGTMAAMAAMAAYAAVPPEPGEQRGEEKAPPPQPDIVMDLLMNRRSPPEDIAADLPRVGRDVAAFCASQSLTSLHDVMAVASGMKEPQVAVAQEVER